MECARGSGGWRGSVGRKVAEHMIHHIVLWTCEALKLITTLKKTVLRRRRTEGKFSSHAACNLSNSNKMKIEVEWKSNYSDGRKYNYSRLIFTRVWCRFRRFLARLIERNYLWSDQNHQPTLTKCLYLRLFSIVTSLSKIFFKIFKYWNLKKTTLFLPE